MHDLGRWKAVEVSAAGVGVGADVFRVNQIAHLHVRKLRGEGDGIERVARGAEDGADLSGPLFEASHTVLAVVKDHAAIGVIDTVIDVVAKLAAAERLADDLGDGGGSRCNQETPRLSEDFNRLRE